MDGLKTHAFEKLRSISTGDIKIDELNYNVSLHILGIIKKYENEMTRLDGKKKHFTPAGLHVEMEKAKKDAVQELRTLDEKASWEKDIAEVQKKFDIIQDKSDLQVLIAESRQREVRDLMRQFKGDPLKFEAEFGPEIESGEPDIILAIINNPIKIYVRPELLKTGVEKMRLRQDPAAAQRLEVLQHAQEVYINLVNFTRAELDIESENGLAIASSE